MDTKIIQPIKISPLANLVPLAGKAEQEALNDDIEENGFQRAAGLIVLWKGQVVDGRCRQIACINAGLNPMDYTKELGDMDEAEVITLVKSLNTRRNLTTTQKTVSAYKSWTGDSITQEKAALIWGVSIPSIKNLSSIARSVDILKSIPPSIIIYRVEKRDTRILQDAISMTDIIESLFVGHRIRFAKEGYPKDGQPTDAPKTIAKYLKNLIEDTKLIKAELEDIEWNPDGVIKTEAGKKYYYELVDDFTSDKTKIGIVKLVNASFMIDDTVNINVDVDARALVDALVRNIPKKGTLEREDYIKQQTSDIETEADDDEEDILDVELEDNPLIKPISSNNSPLLLPCINE